MNIDDAVELDLTFAQMAFKKERKAFMEGCKAGWEACEESGILTPKMVEEAWERYNGKRS